MPATATATSTTTRISRNITKSVLSREQMDGVGARGTTIRMFRPNCIIYLYLIVVYRSIGSHALRNLDPFLMLDEFDVQAPGGFPDHPHRGFVSISSYS
jgi:hypothetical protein